MANEYYERLSEMNPGDLADGLAMEAEFDAIAKGFSKLPTPHTGGQGFDGPVRVGDATAPDEAINKKQLDEALGTAKQLAVAAYGNFNATAWATLPSGTYLLFGTGSQITNSPFPLAEAKTYYLTVRHAIGDNLYCDSLLMASLDDSAHADIGREAWRSGPTLAVASAGWKAAVFKSGDTVTGDILGVTAPQFANDQKFATTEFVQRALGNHQTAVELTATTTLTAAHCGRVVNVAGHTPFTVTLPLLSSVPDGGGFMFHSDTYEKVTVARQGSDPFVIAASSTPTSAVMEKGEFLFVYKAADAWRVFGSSTLEFEPQFGSSLAANGYQRLPSGLIIQWGLSSSDVAANTSVKWTYPIAFPTAALSAVATHSNGGVIADHVMYNVHSVTSTAANYTVSGAGAEAAFFIAIGY